VKTRSSGDNSAEGGKPNRSINTQTRLRILPPRVFQHWVMGRLLFIGTDNIGSLK
jgi:hypothetical protein